MAIGSFEVGKLYVVPKHEIVWVVEETPNRKLRAIGGGETFLILSCKPDGGRLNVSRLKILVGEKVYHLSLSNDWPTLWRVL